MAIILIDVFSFPSSTTGDEIYEIYLDDESIFGDITVNYIGSDGFLNDVTEEQRGRTDASLLGDYFSPDGDYYYTVYASLEDPFAITEGRVPSTPLPPSCDLSISAGVTNETSQNADNGTITATATSTFTGKEVSINNTDWFASPHTFTGLAPSNYIIYARDDNGCTTNITKSVEAFDNPIDGGFTNGLPVVTISAGNISKWNAAFNPIVINFQTTPDPSKVNYRMEVEITSNLGVVVGTWSPNTSGFTRADLSSYLKTLVNANDDFQYDVLNWRDIDRAASFTLRYREVWDGDSSVWYLAPYPMYVTWSAKQLGDIYGGNMAEYVTFSLEPNPDLKAKWLTLFEEPTAWVGLPYDNSFILSEYVVDEEIKVRTTSLDINRQPIGIASNLFLLNNDAGYILSDSDSRLIIQQGTLPPISGDGILEQLGINRLMLAGLPSAGVEYFVIQLYTGDDDAPNFITQPLTINILSQCTDPYIYVKWLNTLGGWDYWRFGYDQILQLATSDEISIDRNVFDWEFGETIADTIKKNAVGKITLGCTVPQEKINGILGLHKSTKIQYLFSEEPYKWHTVTISTGQFEVKRSKAKSAEFRFTLSLPQINIQQQ